MDLFLSVSVHVIVRNKNLFSRLTKTGQHMGWIWVHLMASKSKKCSQASERIRTRNCVSPSPTLHLIDAQRCYGEIFQFAVD